MQKWIESNRVNIKHIILLDTHRPWVRIRWHSWSFPRAPSTSLPPTAWSPSWLQSSDWPSCGGRRASSHSGQGEGRRGGYQGRLHVKWGPIFSSRLFLGTIHADGENFQFELPIKSASSIRNGRELLFLNGNCISHYFVWFQHCWMTNQ